MASFAENTCEGRMPRVSVRRSAFEQTSRVVIIAAMASILTCAAAQAQQPARTSTQSDEVIVTATKVGQQQLSKVPMAIQAFSADTLASKQVKEGPELLELIPGASEQGQIGAGYRIFNFRGSGAGGPIGDGMVGYYLDDTPFGIPNNQSAPPLQFFDIERVEVLRGPQGTLYGQGSMGGTIIYRTKNPDLQKYTFEGEAGVSKTEEAGDPNYRVAAGVSLPLVSDKLGIRISGGYDYRAGYNDIYSGAAVGTPRKTDANTITASDVQAVVLFKPTDKLTLRARAWKFTNNQDYLQVMNSLDPPYASGQGSFDGYDKRSAEYYSNTITYDFDGFSLTNATSYQRSLPGGFGVGLDLPGLGQGVLINGGHANSFVNEFRLASNGEGPLHWVDGVFYQKAKGVYNFSITFPALNLNGDTVTRTDNHSFFSEVSYDLMGGKLVPLVGLRYFEDDRTAQSHSNGVPASSGGKLSATTWRANLAYYPTDDWMVFFNSGTGFRSGILQSAAQANAVIADGVPSSLALTPDKLRNLEVGVKGSLFERTLHVAASVYDIRFTDLQSAFGTSIGLAAFANLGDSKTQGIDIEVNWDTPIEGLNLGVVGNVNNSEFTNVISAFTTANPRTKNGEELYNTPPYNWRLDASYDKSMGTWDLLANASATFLGKSRNLDATVNELDAYALYRASIGMRRDRYEISLYGDNLSDERGPTSANGATLLAGPRPRTVGITLRMNTN